MGEVTLEKIHEDLIDMKREIRQLRTLIQEDYELADDVVEDIEESRKRSKDKFVSHEEMKREFG